MLSPRTGFVHATEDVDGFTENNGNIVAAREVSFGQYHVGGEIAYLWGNWEPVVGAVYELDFAKDKYAALDASGNLVVVNRDDDNVLFNAGIRYRRPAGFTGSLEYRGRFGREYIEEDNITATLHIDF